jgi:predicted ATPase
MKIKIKNLGPIYEFDFDLNKDLHLVYGKNNIGKSHGIAAVYLILKTLSNGNLNSFGNYVPDIKREFEKKWGYGFLEYNESEKTKAYGDLYEELLKQFFNSYLLPDLSQSINNSFSELASIENNFSHEKLSIELSFDAFNAKICMKENSVFFIDKIMVHPILHNVLDGEMAFSVFNLFKDIFKDVSTLRGLIYFLPASRSGLYQGMSATGPLLVEISKIRHLMPNVSIGLPTFSEPVSDYFLQLMSVKPNGKSDSFNRIAETIENDILEGTIVFNNQNRKYEYHQNKTDLRLDITLTSSMISELAPIVAFLKYILKEDKNDKKAFKCLFIEEPEAHLHPSVQVVLMQLFAEMANNGVKIIMTTHSDFMFNELSNLILDNKIKAEQVSSMHLVMTEKGSIDKGDMQATSDGIDDYNFSEVAENQYERRMNLLDFKNQ